MNQTSATIDLTHLDVRRIPCSAKHPQIFQRWAEIPVGGHFVLINDHDPVPLYYQFEALFRGAFTWEYLVDGPMEYQIKITRLALSVFATPPPPPRRAPLPTGAAPLQLDLRGLEPPEPMLRILTTLENLPVGTRFQARTDRQPLHLFPELTARGARHSSESLRDGSWLTTISRE